MKKFIKWFVGSLSLALIGLIVLNNVEEWSRLTGEVNRSVLLSGILSTFVLEIISLFCLFKANTERKKVNIILSLFTSLVPLYVFVMNYIVYYVYFVGK